MPGDVFSVLDDLKDALANDETQRALGLLYDLRDAYDKRAGRERSQIERAKQITRSNPGDKPEQVMSFLQETTAAQMNRAGALIAVRTSLAYPEETDEDPVDVVETLKSRERTVADAREGVSDRLADVSLSTFLFVRGVSTPTRPVGKGSSAVVTATVLNVGDEPATGLSAMVQVGDGLTVVDGPEGSDRIPPDGSTTVTASIRADTAGDHTVTVEVTGDPDRDAVGSDQLEVLAKGGFVDRIQRQLDQLRTRVEDASPPSSGKQRQLVTKLDASLDSLSRVEDYVDSSEPKKANNRLNTASKQLGAFINVIEASSKGKDNAKGKGKGRSGLPERRRVAFVEAASDTIELISAARDAAI